jgi:ubiquinone/menaquinone biosynthesis C-methylase UbiE
MSMNDERKSLASAHWRDVDSYADHAAQYLEKVGEAIAPHKRHSVDLMRLLQGGAGLDVGCGMGRETELMAARVGPTGQAIGIDGSAELIEKARARTSGAAAHLRYEVADACAMPFADNSFDAARIERVLQHLHEPMRALSEMVRVVRAGGRVVALEPDWDTVTVAGGDADVMRAVVRYKSAVLGRNGQIGRDLRHMFATSGLTEIMVEPITLWVDNLPTADLFLGLSPTLRDVVDNGIVKREAADVWWQALQQHDASGGFYASIGGTTVAGTVAAKPS